MTMVLIIGKKEKILFHFRKYVREKKSYKKAVFLEKSSNISK